MARSQVLGSNSLSHLIMSSPAQNSEAEAIFGYILGSSKRADKWAAAKMSTVDNLDQYLKALEHDPSARGFFQHNPILDRDTGLYNARKSGLVSLAVAENALWAVPTERLITYFTQKAK